ncbi:MAG: translation initiation factor eIF-1A [Candidatus Aenigmarchaeota archaeon]|nr:translation initiation factor eIF-1A [Candidatus Aenigmarchaeota archaeon]
MAEQPTEIRVRTPRGKELLGVVEAMLGANKLHVRCQDNKMRICRIPGKMRKRVWIRKNDAVLVEPWAIQGDTNGDIIWKYNPTEASWLRRKGILRIE